MLLKACIILVIASIPKTQSELPSITLFCMGDVCYKRVESSSGRNWTEAQKTCMNSGSTLPIVDDLTHQKSFEAAARCLTTEDERKSGLWIVVDSSSDVNFTLWSSGEPNNNASSCISTDAGEKFPNWRDYNCSESLPFICQYTVSSPFISIPAICETPSITPEHIDAASSSLRSSMTGKNSATTPSGSSTKPSVSSTIQSHVPSVSSNEVRQKNDTGSLDTVALGVGLGVGIGVPVIIALVVVVVVCVRRKRRNSNAGGNSTSRKTAASNNSQTTQENNRMEMSETQNSHPHYDNFSSQYATIPAAAAGHKSDAPSTQGTVYADLSFNQAGHS